MVPERAASAGNTRCAGEAKARIIFYVNQITAAAANLGPLAAPGQGRGQAIMPWRGRTKAISVKEHTILLIFSSVFCVAITVT
jgi:hypothetical protein